MTILSNFKGKKTGRIAVLGMVLSFFSITFAVGQTGSIGDLVWHDVDADGVQDGGEVGLSGVTVNLYNNSMVLLASTTTNGSGIYSFGTLTVPGSYFVEFIRPTGYNYSRKSQGGNTSLDSDASETTGLASIGLTVPAPTTTKIDCGMYRKGTVNGHLYQDVNNNGTQDIGEPNLDNVQISISPSFGSSVTVTTNVSGNWTAEIVPGNATYDIIETSSSFFDLGYVWNEGVVVTPNSKPFVVPEGSTVNVGNDGFFLKSGVSNLVWHDSDMDGIQDVGETGISGVFVYLYRSADDEFIDFSITDANGVYRFIDITPDTYYLYFGLPTGYKYSPLDAGVDDAKDSDVDPGTLVTAGFTLLSGVENTAMDCGLYELGSISNYVWYDFDDDGIQDVGETGLSGVTVTLYQSDGTTVISTDVTDVNGEYSFIDLEPATYVVGFTAPSGYAVGQQDQGGDDALDSDPSPTTGKTGTIVISEGEDDTSIDCALIGTGTIGEGLVWEDNDGNDVQDVGESGIDGVTVDLLSVPAETVLKTTTTAGGGKYKFEKLAPASYKVKFTKPGSHDGFSTKDQGSDDAKDSDADETTGKTDAFSLSAGGTDDTKDCGLYKNVTMSGKVWHDLNADGRKDFGESGENGVIVKLRNFDGSVDLATTSTSGDGDYSFSGKKPGTYRLKFEKSSVDHYYSPKDVGPDDDDDSDCDDDAGTNPGQTDQFSCSSGSTKSDLKCGQFLKAKIGNYVWLDEDVDGIQDGGESGLGSVTVKLYKSNGFDLVGTQTTSGAGAYEFTGLTPASYIVQFDNPSGYYITLKDQGGDDAVDSDADPTTKRTGLVTLTSGQTDHTRDCGMYQYGSIADLVWVDTDADGVQDGGESGLDGITVNLYQSDGTTFITSAITTGGGLYQFTDLEPATYVVKFVTSGSYFISPADQGGDDALDSDANVSTGKTTGITVAAGQIITNVDCGMYLKASLGNYVWYDTNNDGVQDMSETGLDGVTVNLLGSDGSTVLNTDITTMGGGYGFTDLTPGNYYIEFVALPGHTFSPQDQGGDDALDSDANPANGKTAVITLTSGQTNNTIDAGLGEKAAIGDLVWNDLDADGIKDPGESGINGVTVKLYQSDGVSQLNSTVTAGGGLYAFANLDPGTYVVGFTLPANYFFSPQDQGFNEAVDSDPNVSTGKTGTITLIAGQTNDDIDAGMFDKPDLGNFVWEDTDQDGIQDVGETGINGVTVTLYQSDGITVVGTQVTAGGGLYSFANVTPGTYLIGVTAPSGYTISPLDQGGDDNVDSDVNPSTGKTVSITLTSGNTNNTVDCGLYGDGVDLEVTKSVNNPAPSVNDIVTFTIRIDNLSSATGTGILLSDLLNSSSFEYQTHATSQGSYNQVTGVWTVGPIAGTDYALLTIDAKVLVTGVSTNTATITAADQSDPVPGNNSDIASVNATSSGGGGGGIESNGDLSSYIALRKFIRTKENSTELLNQVTNLTTFTESLVSSGIIHSATNLKGATSSIVSYIPETGPINSKGHISTPTDLLGMSNATEVFSVDYFSTEDKRLGVIMAMTTPARMVYNHTKVICDRLTGGSLENVRYVDILGHRFILSLIAQENGEMDYTVSFVAYQDEDRFVIDNQWSKEWYKPQGNSPVFNFQVWSISRETTIEMVSQILNRMDSDHDLSFLEDGNKRIPTLFVKRGMYENGNMRLTVNNPGGASELVLKGTYTRTEKSNKEPLAAFRMPLNPQLKEQELVIPVGHVFDLGFTVSSNNDTGIDELYFADGAWGRYVEENAGTINKFTVDPAGLEAGEGEFVVERNASLSGSVKTYVSLFRNLTTRKDPVDLSGYNRMTFEASGEGMMEIVMVKDGIASWSNQFRKVIQLSSVNTNYSIDFAEFTSLMGGGFTGEDLVTIVFNALGNQVTEVPFEMNIGNLKFDKSAETVDPSPGEFGIHAYPNPFRGSTTLEFALYKEGPVKIELYDLTGRVVDVIAEKEFGKGKHRIVYNNGNLNAGSYFCRLYFDETTESIQISVIQ